MDFSTPTARWAALTSRNRLADTHFVYAVRTTKIYCRPSCAARLARRANVEFYATPALAVKAGYRACKRCKPDSAPQEDPQDVAVAKACEIIRAALSSSEHPNGHIGLNELAERVQLTPSYLHKTFKARTGVTPKAYEEGLRNFWTESDNGTGPRGEVLVPSLLNYDDTQPTFADGITGLDFNFGDESGVDALSDTAGLTLSSLSEGSTSINTPLTMDWSWLDWPETAAGTRAFFDEDALAQATSHREAVAGWNDQLFIPYGKNWDVMSDAGGGRSTSLEDVDGTTMY